MKVLALLLMSIPFLFAPAISTAFEWCGVNRTQFYPSFYQELLYELKMAAPVSKRRLSDSISIHEDYSLTSFFPVAEIDGSDKRIIVPERFLKTTCRLNVAFFTL